MPKHFIDAPQDIKQEDLRKFPDRTDVSKLYPNPTASPKVDDASAQEHRTVFPYGFSVLAGTSLIVPFILAALLFNYFLQSIRASNVFFFLPLITLSALAVVALVIFVYRKVSHKILNEGYDSLAIIMFHASCLMCLALPLYLLFFTIQVLYLVAIILLSILLMWTFLRIATSSKAGKTKNSLILIISGISLLISIFYLIYR